VVFSATSGPRTVNNYTQSNSAGAASVRCGCQLQCTRRVHIGETWQIRINRPCAAAMRPHVKLLWPLVYLVAAYHDPSVRVLKIVYNFTPTTSHLDLAFSSVFFSSFSIYSAPLQLCRHTCYPLSIPTHSQTLYLLIFSHADTTHFLAFHLASLYICIAHWFGLVPYLVTPSLLFNGLCHLIIPSPCPYVSMDLLSIHSHLLSYLYHFPADLLAKVAGQSATNWNN